MSKGQQFFPKLFEKGYIRGKEVKNRVVMPAMAVCTGQADRVLSDDLIAYFEERAKNNVGIIITEGLMVSKDHGIAVATMINLNDVRNDYQLEKLADTIHKYDTLIFAQLLHGGSVSLTDPSINKELVGPSALPGAFYLSPPRELTHEEVVQIEDDFVRAAVKCAQAKLDGVELHGAHGYLIHQFLSPLTNQRKDEYGGSFENRMRFVTNIFTKARAAVPNDFVIGIRINGDDFTDGGMNSEVCVEVAKHVEKTGFDYINVSSGTYGSISDTVHLDRYHKPTHWKNSYIVPVKNAIKKIPVFAVNTIKTPAQAEKALKDGVQDFVCVGRGLLADPEFVSKAETGRAEEIHTCIGCLRCWGGGDTFWATRCSVNPRLGRETVFTHMDENGNGRNAVVIGAGPGGIMAAKTLAEKGFAVTLFEKHNKIGGALLIGSNSTGKDRWVWLVNSWGVELKKLGVKIKLSTQVNDLAEIKALKPYVVVLATGGTPITPNIPNVNQSNVVQAHSVLTDEVKIKNKNVAIIGSGMTGIETGEYLLKDGNKVVFYDMLDDIAKGIPAVEKFYSIMKLQLQGVQFSLLHKLKRINKDEIVFDDLKDGGEKTYKADMIVLSLGVTPETTLKDALEAEFDKVIVIGNAHGGKFIYEATTEAYGKMWVL